MSEESGIGGFGDLLVRFIAKVPRTIGLITPALVAVWFATLSSDIPGQQGEMLKWLGVGAAFASITLLVLGEALLYIGNLFRQLLKYPITIIVSFLIINVISISTYIFIYGREETFNLLFSGDVTFSRIFLVISVLTLLISLAIGLLPLAGIVGGGLILFLVSSVSSILTRLRRSSSKRTSQEQSENTPEDETVNEREPIESALHVDDLRIELGFGLVSLVNDIVAKIEPTRRQIASELGFVMPSVRIQDSLNIPPNDYGIHIKDIDSRVGELRPTMLLIMDPRGEQIQLLGEETKEPTFGLPAIWVEPEHREEALFKGYTVVDPATVVITHLTEVVKENMAELLTTGDTQELLNKLNDKHQKIAENLFSKEISLVNLQRVLQKLLSERVSIRDLPKIIEGFAEASTRTSDPTKITEHVRTLLSRQICRMNVNDQNALPVVVLSDEWNERFSSLGSQREDKSPGSLDSAIREQFMTQVTNTYERLAKLGEFPVLLTSPEARPFVRAVIEQSGSNQFVMSRNEVYAKIQSLVLATI